MATGRAKITQNRRQDQLIQPDQPDAEPVERVQGHRGVASPTRDGFPEQTELCYNELMKHIALSAALLLIAPLMAPAASAQMIVVGEGAAQNCYQYALMGNSGTSNAIKACSRALQSDMVSRKDLAATYVNRGVLLMRSGDYDAAIDDYRIALDDYPDLAEAHINYGVALYHRGDMNEALAAYDRALEIGSDKDALAHFNRALIHERQQNAPAAYRDYKAASELKPEWEQPREALSRFTVTKRSS